MEQIDLDDLPQIAVSCRSTGAFASDEPRESLQQGRQQDPVTSDASRLLVQQIDAPADIIPIGLNTTLKFGQRTPEAVAWARVHKDLRKEKKKNEALEKQAEKKNTKLPLTRSRPSSLKVLGASAIAARCLSNQRSSRF
eukprot:7579305-Pyramimonas_sp.AAC.1